MFYNQLEKEANEIIETENFTFDSAVKEIASKKLQEVSRINSEDLELEAEAEADVIGIVYKLYNEQFLVVIDSPDLDESFHCLRYDDACAKATERVFELSN